MNLKKAVRTAQTYAAPLLETKAWTQRKVRSAIRVPSEPSYRAFREFPFTPGQQFIDVGANRGQTIDSVRLYNSGVPLVAFEPNPILADRLTARYASDTATIIYPFGLGKEGGFFDLYVPYYRNFMFDGLASFEWKSAHDWLNKDSIYGFKQRHLRIERVRCEVRRWDDVDTHPALVKIDVQGFESSVLVGGLQTVRRHRPVFLIENDAERPHETILFAEGYRRAGYTRGRPVMDAIGEGNTYYVPEEKIPRFQEAYL